MRENGRFYEDPVGQEATHLALRWKGRVLYTVPRESIGQRACWNAFRPGLAGIPLRAMARLQGVVGCAGRVEGPVVQRIRGVTGCDRGLTCCRAGARGVWSKDTVLLLDADTAEPRYFAKIGAGAPVDALLRNEVSWLRRLSSIERLRTSLPEIVAHRSGEDVCFVAQSALSGQMQFSLKDAHMDFIDELQKVQPERLRYEESRLFRNVNQRLADLKGRLSLDWASRLARAMQRMQELFSGSDLTFVAAHNDFTPWNIRLRNRVALVFDWEYAEVQQMPLFDPLHFALMPDALAGRSTERLIEKMGNGLRLCLARFGSERCYQPEGQALAYMTNLCTLYLWADPDGSTSNPAVRSYAQAIDHLCRK
jgi:hypothetical protein